jgi:hypothetical protein
MRLESAERHRADPVVPSREPRPSGIGPRSRRPNAPLPRRYSSKPGIAVFIGRHIFNRSFRNDVNARAIPCCGLISYLLHRADVDVMSTLGQKQTSRSEIPMSALPPKADIRQCKRHVRFVPKADIGLSTRVRRKPPSVSTPAPAGSRPRSHYIRLLPSKFRRDFVILGGLRVVTPARSALLPNRRLLGPGDEEGLGRLLGDGARGGEHNAAVLEFGFRATAACASRRSTVRS